jgi:transposase-like protein
MPKISDQLRAEAVTEYLRGTTTQEEVCVVFEARTGHPLSPRTLRSWVARFSSGGRADVRTRALLADALDQVRVLEARLQAALGQFDGEASAPMPVRHVQASNEPLPPTATSAASVGISSEAVPHLRGTAAGLPLGIEERATKDEPISTKFSWD